MLGQVAVGGGERFGRAGVAQRGNESLVKVYVVRRGFDRPAVGVAGAIEAPVCGVVVAESAPVGGLILACEEGVHPFERGDEFVHAPGLRLGARCVLHGLPGRYLSQSRKSPATAGGGA